MIPILSSLHSSAGAAVPTRARPADAGLPHDSLGPSAEARLPGRPQWGASAQIKACLSQAVSTFAALALIGSLGLGVAHAQGPGTLHVLDSFVTAESHGHNVVRAAHQAGFSGPIEAINVQGRADDGQRVLEAMAQMKTASGKQFLKALDSYATHKQIGLMHAATDAIEGMSRAGVHSSALNISRNQNQAEILADAWSFLVEPENGQALHHAIQAFGLNEDKIMNPDPRVSGVETHKLQQALVDRIHQAVHHSPEVKQAKAGYDHSVASLAQRNVSVVVSSGNEGELASVLEHQAFHDAQRATTLPAGAHLRLPGDFYDNPLSNQHTTTVGAVQFTSKAPGQLAGAVYADSTPSKNVTVYADGEVQVPGHGSEHGTSFAAPVTAAGLAHAHGVFPQLSPALAQKLLQQNLTTQLPQVGHGVVDPNRLASFLKTSTF